VKIFFNKWWRGFLSILIYAALGFLTPLSASIAQLSETQWETVINKTFLAQHFWTILIPALVGSLSSVRAVMNKDWHEASTTKPSAT
jgi:hypothetical protein